MTSVFQLPSELTIYSVGATRDTLLAWLTEQDVKPGDVVDIDAAHVEDIDGAGVQLLGALTSTLTQRGLHWQVKEPSVHLLEICSAMGSRNWLERTDAPGVSA